MDKKKVLRIMTIIAGIIAILMFATASVFILIGTWYQIDDMERRAIYILCTIGGFLGGTVYVYLFVFAESAIKHFLKKHQKQKQNEVSK